MPGSRSEATGTAFEPGVLEQADRALRRCSFCGEDEALAGPLIGGDQAYICEACLSHCNRVLELERQSHASRLLEGLPAPRRIRAYLDDYIIGQERAKKALAVAVYNHYKRLIWAARRPALEIGKSNILLVGPSGSGKSYIAERLARCVDVPFVTVDATTLTASGYTGDNAEGVVERLLAACDYDPERAARGIVYIDELDKLAAREGANGGRDISGEGAQQALLQLLEGRSVTVTVQRRQCREVTLDTRQVLFIAGGAFEGLAELAERRAAPRGVGFTAAVEREGGAPELAAEDFRRYGLLPELIGRFPVIESLEPLGVQELVAVLTEPRNAPVRQYQALFERDGCELLFTREALLALAERAHARGTGARGLRAVLEQILLEPMYAVPAVEGTVERLTIDAEAVSGQPPLYELAEQRRRVG